MIFEKLLVLLTILGSTMAVGGTSDQDPTIAFLRAKFMAGKGPKKAELMVGTVWKCAAFSAWRDNFAMWEGNKHTFSQVDGLYRVQTSWVEKSAEFLTPTSDGLIGIFVSKTGDEANFDTVRVTLDGDLVEELSRTGESSLGNKAEPAISNPRNFSSAFILCPKVGG